MDVVCGLWEVEPGFVVGVEVVVEGEIAVGFGEVVDDVFG